MIPGSVPTCHKRKAPFGEALSEADTVYEIPKKQKKDEGIDSDNKTCTVDKKRSKSHQEDEKPLPEKNQKGPEEKEKDDSKIEKQKSVKSEHNSETGASGLLSSEQQTKHAAKKERKHEKKKKKSKERSERNPSSEKSSKSSKHSSSGSRKHVRNS